MSSTTYSNPATSTLSFFLSLVIILSCFPSTTRSDEPCPYPCYPPPTGSGITPTTPSTPPTPPSPSGTTAPPAPPQSGFTYPPPSVNYPFNPSPPFGGGGSSNTAGGFGAPPPPEPILPYFPFYYRKPPHKPDDSSSSSSSASPKVTMQKWTWMIATSSSLFHLLHLFV